MAYPTTINAAKGVANETIDALRARLEPWAKKGRVPAPAWFERHGHWALRLPLALMLWEYGRQKFPDALTDPSAFGVPAPLFVLAAFAEVLAPIALIVGGVLESRRVHDGWWRLAADALTRAGGFAGAAAVGGVIVYFMWPVAWTDSHVMQLGLALYLMMRGARL